jgi:hypothetical protein
MTLRVLYAIGAICAAASLPIPASALTVTLEECGEGADFIRNAALSRDNGLAAEAFLRRMDDDLMAIRSVPPALRWFVRDADDERLLRIAALDVFVDPRGAEAHHRDFLQNCRETVRADAGKPPSIAALPRD